MRLSPRDENHLAILLFVLSMALFLTLAVRVHGVWVIGAMVTAFGYGIWSWRFSCPNCGLPLLYELKAGGLLYVPASLPAQCRKCGHSTRAKRHDG